MEEEKTPPRFLEVLYIMCLVDLSSESFQLQENVLKIHTILCILLGFYSRSQHEAEHNCEVDEKLCMVSYMGD